MSGSAYEPLAIVGMACRLPGANNLAEYWRMLIEGRSAIREIPADRFNQELYYDPIVGTPGNSYSKLAAVLADRDFHREACPIDEQLENSADITHLMMCETAATAIQQAAIDPFDLPSRNVGVYIGHVHGSSLIGDFTYARFIEEATDFLNDVDDFQRLPPDDRQAVMEGLIERVQKGRPLPSGELDVASSMATTGINKEEEDAVAVVGMGCLFPGALDVERFWELLTSGRDPKHAVPPDRWRLDVVHSLSSDQTYHRDAMVGGFMTDFEYDWRRHRVPPKQIANADPLQFMLLEATDQAIRDAGYDKTEFDRTRTGVVVGTEFGGDFACQLHMGLRLPEMEKLLFEIFAARGITGKLAENIVQGYASSLLSQWTAMTPS